MANEIHRSSTTNLSIGEDEIVTPLSSWTLFWRPRYQRAPVELINVPFFFWLAYTLRPRVMVTIGDTTGTTHFALCQAADKLDLDTRCLAVCLGGLQAEGEIPAALQDYNDDTYPELSRLTPQPPMAAARRFAEGSVDLVVLSLASQEDPEGWMAWLEAAWLPRLSPRGILILTGVNRDIDERATDSPVDRLMRRYPHFHLENGNGLLLFAVGDQPEDRLRRLCEIQNGAPGHSALSQIYGRIGRGLQFEAAGRESEKRLAQVETEFRTMRHRLAEIESERDTLRETVAQRPGVAPVERAETVVPVEPAAPAAAGGDPEPGETGDLLVILTEAFERQQIASDATIEELRRSLAEIRRENEVLEGLLRQKGLEAGTVLTGLRPPAPRASRAARAQTAEAQMQRLQDQLATLADLRASLFPKPPG